MVGATIVGGTPVVGADSDLVSAGAIGSHSNAGSGESSGLANGSSPGAVRQGSRERSVPGIGSSGTVASTGNSGSGVGSSGDLSLGPNVLESVTLASHPDPDRPATVCSPASQ